MVQIDIDYLGNLRTIALHTPSNSELVTDAPKDNQGMGESFSPTDLLATAYGTCVLTIMGIAARTHSIDLSGASITVQKIMKSEPKRMVGQLNAHITFAREYSEKEMAILMAIPRSCPVSLSLNPDIIINITHSIKTS